MVAFIDKMWREVIIHELHKNEAYVIPVNQKVKPALVDLCHVKSNGVPVDALNKMEADIAQRSNPQKDELIGAYTSNDSGVHSVTNNYSRNSITLTPSLLLSSKEED